MGREMGLQILVFTSFGLTANPGHKNPGTCKGNKNNLKKSYAIFFSETQIWTNYHLETLGTTKLPDLKTAKWAVKWASRPVKCGKENPVKFKISYSVSCYLTNFSKSIIDSN